MALFNVEVYTGTPQSLAGAVACLETAIEEVTDGSEIWLADIKDVGPGHYWRPVLVREG